MYMCILRNKCFGKCYATFLCHLVVYIKIISKVLYPMCFISVFLFFTFASKIKEMFMLVAPHIKYKDLLQMLEFNHNIFAVIDID